MRAPLGATLESTPGTWTNADVVNLRWQRGDQFGASMADIVGATGSKYTVQAADVGKTLRCVATAKHGSNSTEEPGPTILTEGVTQFTYTFGYGPGGESGHECTLAAYPAPSAGARVLMVYHEAGVGQGNPEAKPGELTLPKASAGEGVGNMSRQPQAEALQALGFCVFNVNWRQGGEEFRIEPPDVMASFEWAHTNASYFNGDPNRLCGVGGSDGGYLGMLAAILLNKRHGAGYVKAFGACSGRSNVEKLIYYEQIHKLGKLGKLASLIGCKQSEIETAPQLEARHDLQARCHLVSPPSQLHANIPYLGYWMSEEETTPYEQLPAMTAAIEAAGLSSKYKGVTVPGSAHGWSLYQNVKNELIAFLEAHS